MAPISSNVAMLLNAAAPRARRHGSTRPRGRCSRTSASSGIVDSQVRSPSPVYAHTYWQGRELVARHVDGDPARLRELMTRARRPGDLA
jgi:predicted nicotinamide N-methyase